MTIIKTEIKFAKYLNNMEIRVNNILKVHTNVSNSIGIPIII